MKEIGKYYPFEDENITKYAEPFVGGGAVLFDILSKYDLKEIYISDINAELINTYRIIRNDIDALLECFPLCKRSLFRWILKVVKRIICKSVSVLMI